MPTTLDELKAKNAAGDSVPAESGEDLSDKNNVDPQDDSDTAIGAVEQSNDKATSDNSDDSFVTQSEDTEEPLEEAKTATEEDDWLDDSEKETGEKRRTVPLKTHIKVKSTLKETKAESAREIDSLKAKIQALESTVSESEPLSRVSRHDGGAGPRPKRSEFWDAEDPDEAYDEAIDAWTEKKFDQKLASQRQQAIDENKHALESNRIKQAVDNFYYRAEKLVSSEKEGVSSESYRSSDKNIRGLIESLYPGRGDETTDFLLSRLDGLGVGAEKVWHKVGDNQKGLQMLKEKLSDDLTGVSAALWLGSLHSKIGSSRTKTSNAQKPGSNLKGDISQAGGSQSRALKRKYESAVKSGNMQARIDIRRDAKAAGVDVNSW